MYLKVFLLVVLLLGQTHPSAAAVKLGEKCSKVGVTTKFKSKSYICIKSGKVNRWAEKKSPVSKATASAPMSPSSGTSAPSVPVEEKFEQLLISTMPEATMNTTFMLGKPQSRDIGESLFFDSAVKLSSIEFQISAFTWISPDYHLATEDEKHNLEKPINPGQYKPFPAKINVSLWRDEVGILSSIPETFDLRSGFTKVEEFDVKTYIELGRDVKLSFPKPTTFKSGYYYLNLYFIVEDLNITTLRFGGCQTGNNTLGGPNKDMPTNCNYSPAEDFYPKGQAYFSYQDTFWDQKSPSEKWNYQTPRSYTFKLHNYAKVNECIVIGQYNDILNTGDIRLNLYGLKI